MNSLDLTSKRATREHPDFAALVRGLDAELLGRYGDEQSNFDPHNVLSDTARIILLYAEGECIACGCFRPFSQEGTVEIKRMYVKPSYRGKGVGRRILSELERWAIEDRFTNAVLETGTKQPEAIATYTKAGYRVIENYGPYKNSSYSVCMAKRIAEGKVGR